MLALIDRLIAGTVSSAKWLALAVALLLFAQWPLRELVGAYSREANDLGQCLFALFVAVSVTAATRSNQHIAADGFAGGYSARTRRIIAIIGIVFGVLPWAVFVLVTAWPSVYRSALVLERFQDTGNQGYFIVKLALIPLVVLMLAQASVDLFKHRVRGDRDR